MAKSINPEFQPETNPDVPWYQRGGFTTIAAISLALGAISLIVLGVGLIFGDIHLAAGYVPFPSVIGLLFGVLGTLGPWKVTAVAGAVLNIAALVLGMIIGAG
ncbi:hypothetical protein [Gulosibacter molinativorax]|uniref:Uncharacterized protein n=1 Tax=Gulosibacter molinativorax TaxID=256821 RepID=A0ABT7C8X7_9MICO|nr:hypothetical protein [Gulosibacter molinativorax]MDJ1371219.1 hypothetical protein [Gulosibacter molinativorax]QUY63035.1 Hypotetical protein [Gulosibacter molinativorax]